MNTSSRSNELRVFISSTFRDMTAEREHLIKKVFPEIRTLCRERGVTFTDVDLRWGLTEEEAALGRIVRTCLEEVDKCRPYFIGMIGNRYGWTPELHEILMDPELLSKYPWVEELTLDGVSVTEMEFVHGVFNAPGNQGESAFFYRRLDDLSEADNPERLTDLIDRAQATGYPLREYETVETLGQQIHDDLIEMINANWPQSEAPSDLELLRRSHASFAASRIRAYIPNPLYLKAFTEWSTSGTTPLVITGSSGLGKSSLVAFLVDYYRKRNPTAFIVEHYVGVSEGSGSSTSVVRHIVEEIKERFSVDREIAINPDELTASFANWLFTAEEMAAEIGIPVLIVVDAVNQLDQRSQELLWLPETIPAGVKLVLSITPGLPNENLSAREWEQLGVKPLEDERVRQSIVVRYLGEFHKGISAGQLHRIASSNNASSPLYLRIVAEELRLHGEHETLDRVIDHYGEAADLEEVFQKVLQRMEEDYGSEAIRSLLSLIWGSHLGLSEVDLLLLTGLSRVDFSRLLFALDYHLIRRDGRLDFFHDYLRRAVEQRYLRDESVRQEWWRRLRDYFAEAEITLPSTLELLYALKKLGEQNELKHLLAEIPRYLLLWEGLERFEVMMFWAGSESQEIVEAYRNSLHAWKEKTAPTKGEEAEVLGHLSELFLLIPEWSETERLCEAQLELLRELNDRESISKTLSRLAQVAIQIGNPDKAAERVAEAETIARESGNLPRLGMALAEQGPIALSRAEFERAETCFTESLEVYQQAKDKHGIYTANTGLGATHFAVGNYQEAHTYCVIVNRIARELSNRFDIATAISNVGLTNMYLGNNEEAMRCFREQETIARELGARDVIAASLWNQGHLHLMQNEYVQALACITEQEKIVRALGNRLALISALNLRGMALKDLGKLEEAIECFNEQEELAREAQDQYGVAVSLGSRAAIFLSEHNYEKALDYFQQQKEIYQMMGTRKGLYLVLSNIGLVYIEQGKYEEALSSFAEGLQGLEEIGYPYGISICKVSTAKGLVEIAINQTEMPSFLHDYVPELSPESWQADTLRRGRQLAEEGVQIATDIMTPDVIFPGLLVLARINAAEGKYEEAIEIMRSLLNDPTHEQTKSTSYYWLWKILRSENRQPEEIEKARQEALRYAEEDYNKSPAQRLKKIIEEIIEVEKAET